MTKEKFYNGKDKKYLYFGIILILFNAIGAFRTISDRGFPDNPGEIFGMFLLGIIGIIFIINYFIKNKK